MKEHPAVELVLFAGCPHAVAARENLEAAFRALGREPRWREWDLTAPDVPARLIGYPSPTVLVGGVEIHGKAPSTGSPGLTCRVDGAPPVTHIVEALSRA